jgi:hypothetical protein
MASLAKIAFAFVTVVFFYYFVGETPDTEATRADIVWKAYASAFLFLLYFWISPKLWAQSLALIELFLFFASCAVVYNWEKGDSWFYINYHIIQDVSYVAELIIIGISICRGRHDTIGSGSSDSNSYSDSRVKNRSGAL